jgi:hypothetical protein
MTKNGNHKKMSEIGTSSSFHAQIHYMKKCTYSINEIQIMMIKNGNNFDTFLSVGDR